MKNKNNNWRLTLKFMIFSLISLFLALLMTILVLYAAYKFLDSERLRVLAMWGYEVLEVFLREFPWQIFLLIFFIFALSFNFMFNGRTIKRLNAVIKAIIQIQSEDYRVALPNNNHDSIGELERGIGELARRVEDDLNKREGLEKSKDDFIVNIAHDLRTPLTSIIGYLGFISEKQLDPEITIKYANIAFEKSKQLETLVETLFDIANFAVDNIKVEKEEINLQKFLLQKQDEMFPQLAQSNMEIRLDISAEFMTFFADGTLLARVFDNLISNSIRYASDGKFIDIIASNTEKSTRISFVTHANPIPENELERVFDKTYRLDKSRTGGNSGAGLGLSISRRIIELHGGTLTARKTADGTAFDILLPNN